MGERERERVTFSAMGADIFINISYKKLCKENVIESILQINIIINC